MARWIVKSLIAIALVGVGGAGALAKTPPKKTGSEVQDIRFDKGAEVSAEVLRPDQSVADVLLMGRRGSLIKERKDFVDEILRSAEDL